MNRRRFLGLCAALAALFGLGVISKGADAGPEPEPENIGGAIMPEPDASRIIEAARSGEAVTGTVTYRGVRQMALKNCWRMAPAELRQLAYIEAVMDYEFIHGTGDSAMIPIGIINKSEL